MGHKLAAIGLLLGTMLLAGCFGSNLHQHGTGVGQDHGPRGHILRPGGSTVQLPSDVKAKLYEVTAEWEMWGYQEPLHGGSLSTPLWAGRIAPGDHRHLRFTVPEGKEWYVVSAASRGVRIDMDLYSAGGELIGSDHLEDSWPVVKYEQGGEFEAVVHNRDASLSTTVGLIVVLRDAAE